MASSPFCETGTGSVTLSSSALTVNVGDTFNVRVTLKNEGCLSLGVPQYIVSVSTPGSQPSVVPTDPEPIVHYLAVDPGQADSEEFAFQAVAPGSVEFNVSASFEVHQGYPGPAYWGTSTSLEPLRILVVSSAIGTPTPEASFTIRRIPEVPLTLTFPSGYMLTKNQETNRRGSFAAYDFTPLQGYKTPYLKEIQFFSAESMEEFTRGCLENSPCFFGDYPDLERYYEQWEAYRERKDLREFKRSLIGERYYFVSNHPCEGDICLIREYTTFLLDDIKVDVWITMEDETQSNESDELLLSLKLQE
jgi:hypothetical protein